MFQETFMALPIRPPAWGELIEGRADRMAKFFRAGALEDCVPGSSAFHSADQLAVIADAQGYHPSLWKTPKDPPRGFRSVHLWHPTVHDHHVRPQPLNRFQGLLSVAGVADDLDVFICQEDQSGGCDDIWVVIHQKDPDKATCLWRHDLTLDSAVEEHTP